MIQQDRMETDWRKARQEGVSGVAQTRTDRAKIAVSSKKKINKLKSYK